MSDPIRLDETSSPALAAVLRSAAADAPAHTERELERISAAASLVIGGVGGGGVAASSSPWLRRATWLVLGTAVAVTGGGAWWAGASDRAPSSEVTPREPEPHAMVVPAAAPPSSAPPVISVRVDDLPAARVESVTARAAAAPSAPPVLGREARAAAAELPDELSMIDAVRSALAAGKPAEALDRLEAYRRAYPHPSFDVEGDVLEVQALAALGQSDAARAKAERFLRSHPGSPYEKRIKVAANLREAETEGR